MAEPWTFKRVRKLMVALGDDPDTVMGRCAFGVRLGARHETVKLWLRGRKPGPMATVALERLEAEATEKAGAK